MEKQSNSDTEQMNESETLTYTVGQLQLQAIPSLNILYTDPHDGSILYLMKDGEEFYLYADVKSVVDRPRLRHFQQVFTAVILGLMERGLDHICAWVKNDEKDLNLATFFGFEETGFIKALHMVDRDTPLIIREMLYTFPILD